MTTVDAPSHPFNWMTVPPGLWPVQTSMYDQKCGRCKMNTYNHEITNARGVWEHFACAKQAYDIAHSRATVHTGTQRQFIEFLQSVNRVAADFDPDRGRDQRYRWWIT